MTSIYVDQARLQIEKSNPYGNGWYLAHIFVPEEYRQQGLGSKALAHLCKMADEDCASIYLEIDPDSHEEGPQYPALRDWYAKFGFKFLRHIPVMKRNPTNIQPDQA